MAWVHAEMVEDGQKIQHGWWGLLYSGFAAAAAWFSQSWILFILAFLIRKVVFDISFNFFHVPRLPIFHVSKTTTSIIDKIHLKLFGKSSKWYLIFYMICIITLNCYLILK